MTSFLAILQYFSMTFFRGFFSFDHNVIGSWFHRI